ncbi:MAG: hypothetical protein WBQ94_17120 [Terracidiphilus sp.]
MPKTHATQRTLKELRKQGWSCHIVEKYIKHPGMPFGRRIDAFGIGDILCMRPPCANGDIHSEAAIALVQCFPNTSGTGFADHREKILAIPETKIWLRAGGKIFLYGWKLKKKTGRWEWKREEVIFGA